MIGDSRRDGKGFSLVMRLSRVLICGGIEPGVEYNFCFKGAFYFSTRYKIPLVDCNRIVFIDRAIFRLVYPSFRLQCIDCKSLLFKNARVIATSSKGAVSLK